MCFQRVLLSIKTSCEVFILYTLTFFIIALHCCNFCYPFWLCLISCLYNVTYLYLHLAAYSLPVAFTIFIEVFFYQKAWNITFGQRETIFIRFSFFDFFPGIFVLIALLLFETHHFWSLKLALMKYCLFSTIVFHFPESFTMFKVFQMY